MKLLLILLGVVVLVVVILCLCLLVVNPLNKQVHFYEDCLSMGDLTK